MNYYYYYYYTLILHTCSYKVYFFRCLLNCYLLNPLTSEHELVGVVRDGEDVRWGFNPLLASVSRHNNRVVHWEPLVWIDSGAEQARVGLKRRSSSFTMLLLYSRNKL